MNEGTSGKRTVLIVEDHPVTREGLSLAIRDEEDLQVCAEASTAIEALEAMREQEPDVAVVDLGLPDKGGLQLIKDIGERHPAVAVLVVSAHSEALYAERALHAGALGYIHKLEAIPKIVEGIKQVLRGRLYVSEETSRRMIRKHIGATAVTSGVPEERLSDRELQVFELIGRGYSTSEIADQLHISAKTVESHRERIKNKLQLDNARELLRYAIQWLEPIR